MKQFGFGVAVVLDGLAVGFWVPIVVLLALLLGKVVKPGQVELPDAVIFANTTGEVFCRPADKHQFNALSADDKRKQVAIAARLVKNLDEYVRAGGGFVGIHSATDLLKNHQAYGEMIGAVFSQHPWGPKETVMIKVENPGHALAMGCSKRTSSSSTMKSTSSANPTTESGCM